MLPLSVVIIAKNEANALKSSLPPVKNWAKEIIVVINDCTDNTKEVAESFGATVIEHAWEGYAKQRNFAQSCAHEAWILKLDADEVISEELKHSIEEFFSDKELVESTTVCKCFRCNRWLGRWFTHFKDDLPILLKKDSVHWENPVHEHLSFKGNVHYLKKGILYHYTEASMLHTIQKNITYAQLSAQDLAHKYSRFTLVLKAVINPGLCFFKCFIFRGYFREKFPGFYYSTVSAFYTFFKYAFAFEKKIQPKE
jgi:Glycosyltransferases involved in cell wall biogenesis